MDNFKPYHSKVVTHKAHEKLFQFREVNCSASRGLRGTLVQNWLHRQLTGTPVWSQLVTPITTPDIWWHLLADHLPLLLQSNIWLSNCWPADYLTIWPSDHWTIGPSDSLTAASWPSTWTTFDCPTVGQLTLWPSDHLTIWPSDHLTIGPSDSLAIWSSDYQTACIWHWTTFTISDVPFWHPTS